MSSMYEVSHGGNSQFGTSLDITRPFPAPREGDLMVAFIAFNATVNTPSGWTAVQTPTQFGFYYKIATAAEPAIYTWTAGSGSASAGTISVFAAIRRTPTPLIAWNTTGSSFGSGSTSITYTTALPDSTRGVDCLVVAAAGFFTNGTTATPSGYPAGYTASNGIDTGNPNKVCALTAYKLGVVAFDTPPSISVTIVGSSATTWASYVASFFWAQQSAQGVL